MKQKKTQTIGTQDDPHWSIYPGHVGAQEFNRAFKAEGWSGGGRIYKVDLKHMWVTTHKKRGKKIYRIHETKVEGSKPYTVTEW